jgi:hypothetical protein
MDDELLPGVDGNQRSVAESVAGVSDDELVPDSDGDQSSVVESGVGSSDDGLDEYKLPWCLAGESQEPNSVSDVEASCSGLTR